MISRTEVDVVVIGGGWTGVAAAAELTRLGIDFRLLEADPTRLGGRAFSFAYDPPNAKLPGHRWEHGAQYIGTQQTAIWALANQYLRSSIVDGYRARLAYTEQIMVIDDKRYAYDRNRCLFNIGGVPPGLGFFDVLSSILVIDLIQTIERSIDVLEPWKSPANVCALDTTTMDKWLTADWITPAARSMINVAVNAVISVEPPQVSPFYFFWYSACNDGFLQECNDENDGPQQYYLSCGIDALVDAVAQPFRGQIVFDSPVKSIVQADGLVTVTTNSGDVWLAKQVIVAMSPHTAGKLDFTPPLPAAVQTLTQQPMGRTIKCMVYYKTPWWRTSHGLAYTGYSGASEYPVIWVMDYSPDDGSDVWCLMTFTIGKNVDALGPHPTQAAVTELVTESLCFLFNDEDALTTSEQFVSLVLYTWNEDTPYACGGPNTCFGPNVLTGASPPASALNQPIGGNLWLASAETTRNLDATATSRYFDPTNQAYSDVRHSLGYMDGAINQGRFVANQVAKGLGATDYNHAIDNTFPSTPPKVDLPGPSTPITPVVVSAVLKELCGLFWATIAVDAYKPPAPMDLIVSIGELLAVAVVTHCMDPSRETLHGIIATGAAAIASNATDPTTQDIKHYCEVLDGLVAVLSAEVVNPATTGTLPARGEAAGVIVGAYLRKVEKSGTVVQKAAQLGSEILDDIVGGAMKLFRKV